MPNKAVKGDGDPRVFFGLRDRVTGGATGRISRFRYSTPGTSRARTLASFRLSPPRLTADVRRKRLFFEEDHGHRYISKHNRILRWFATDRF